MARDINFQKESSGSSGISLAERLRVGTHNAWQEFIELYGPLMEVWCRSFNIPADAIPDVAQEVFVTAFRSLDKFDGRRVDSTFRGWLWTIARSRIMDFHRKQKGKRAEGGSTAHVEINSIVDPLPVDDPTHSNHAAALLHRAMEQVRVEFTKRTWEIFWRATVLEHPTDLIAKELDITTAAIRQAKSRVLRRLRKQLGDL